MSRYSMLGVALFSFTTLAHAGAGAGTVRFSGRIVDPGCKASLALTQQQLRLDHCPLAALGAHVTVAPFAADSGATRNGVLARHALTATAGHSNARVFSQNYRRDVQTWHPSANGYLVVIDYP